MLYKLIIHPEQPLLLSGATMGNYRASLDYIPGSALRGAIAETLAEIGLELSEIFSGNTVPVFSNAYPSLQNKELVFPLPVSAITCKRNREHGIYNRVFLDFAELKTIKATKALPSVCSKCQEDFEAIEDYSYFDKKQLICTKETVKTLATTHVGINRARKVAQDSLLYTREEMLVQDANPFSGYFLGLAYLDASLAAAISETPIHIGANRSRGMGRCTIQAEAYESQPVESGIEDFNDKMQAYFKADDKLFFTLDTLSPYLSDQAFVPVNPEFAWANLELSWLKEFTQSGWNASAGLPRRSMQAWLGTYLYSIPKNLYQSQKNQILAELTRIQMGEQLLGLDTERGFGWFRVCDKFHTMN